MVAEKRRHMHIIDRALWPQRLPWPVRNVYDTPIALWMSKAKQRVPSAMSGVIVLVA